MATNLIDIKDKQKKRFSDFAQEANVLDGAKARIEDVLNMEIEVIGCRVSTSKYTKNKSGMCLTLQFVDTDGSRRVIFTGSDVLIEQMRKHENEIPFFATIKKIDRYYLLT